jgi:23S rRNA (guanosine2251-2'-O)-methyltransferase
VRRNKQHQHDYNIGKQYIYGFHAVNTALARAVARIGAAGAMDIDGKGGGSGRVDELYLLDGRRDARSHELIELAKQRCIPYKFLNRFELDQLVNFAKHQGFVALLGQAQAGGVAAGAGHSGNSEGDLEGLVQSEAKRAFFLVLDGVKDPHNLGACLRTANAAGVDGVIIPKDNAVSLTDTVAKVACGAVEQTPVFQVTNLARTLRMLKSHGIWIYGTALDAEQSLYEAKLQVPLALVLGAEDSGLRRLTREQCDFMVKIPMVGAVQSLNVSVAAAICMFEVVRGLEIKG